MESKEFSTRKADAFSHNYSEKGFWDKLRKESSKAGATVVYLALQLYYVMTSSKVSVRDKALIVGALGYLILPADLIPDLLPAIGYSDDLTALMAVYNLVGRNIDDDIRRRALEKVHDIFGEVDPTFLKLPGQQDNDKLI